MSAAVLHKLGGSGPDILLIHGFGSDRLSWLATAPKMFQLGTIWAVEYAGHGMAGNDIGDASFLPVLRHCFSDRWEAYQPVCWSFAWWHFGTSPSCA